MDHGALFRARSEGDIRQKVLEEDLVEAVIALPPNLFYNTNSPGCIIILNKDKESHREGEVLFVYAEEKRLRESGVQIFEEGANQNYLLDTAADEIKRAYQEWTSEPHFSRPVSLSEIEANEWNLNVPNYVDTTTSSDSIDVEDTMRKIEQKKSSWKRTEERLDNYLDKLQYER
jgi:type I restriction enzyme M protein